MSEITYGIIFNLDTDNILFNEVNINKLQNDIDSFFLENNFTKFNNTTYFTDKYNVVNIVLLIQDFLSKVNNFLVKDFKLIRITDINDLTIML